LLHPACEGEASDPPATPSDGETWLVAAGATGDWAGADGKIASRQSGNWLFSTPGDGMRLLDRSTGQMQLYRGGWLRPSAPAAPTGGTTVDAEARATLADLITALASAGVFPAV